MAFRITKNIGVVGKKRGRGPKYPFLKMEVGDSFSFNKKDRGSIACQATRIKQKTGKTFIIRQWKSGYRLWRVS